MSIIGKIVSIKLKKASCKEKYWKELNQDSKYSYEEECALNIYNKTIEQQTDGRCVVNPLFKKDASKLLNN